MSLINSRALRLWWSLILEDVCLLFRWVPEPRIIYGGDVEVLGDSCDPCGDALLAYTTVGCYE
jgi:hypothetical protein